MSTFRLAGRPPRDYVIEIDGHDITKAVREVTFSVGVDRLPVATIDLLVLSDGAIASSDTTVVIPDDTADALVAMGWMPPEEAK